MNFLSLNIYRRSYINSIDPLCCPLKPSQSRRGWVPKEAWQRHTEGREERADPTPPTVTQADRQPDFLSIPAGASEGLPLQEPTRQDLYQPAPSPCSSFSLKVQK